MARARLFHLKMGSCAEIRRPAGKCLSDRGLMYVESLHDLTFLDMVQAGCEARGGCGTASPWGPLMQTGKFGSSVRGGPFEF